MRLFMATLALGMIAFASHADDKNTQPGTNPGAKASPAKAGPRFNADHFIKDHDTNKDGKLSKDELPQRMQAGFADIDTNKDGFISKDELEKHAASLARRRPEMVEVLYWVIDVPEEHPLSAQEVQALYDTLRKLDKNNDGKIDNTELQQARAERAKDRADSIFKMMDKNGDGKISKDEARGLWSQDFGKLDANKDGSLDRAEVEKALAHPKAGSRTSTPGTTKTSESNK